MEEVCVWRKLVVPELQMCPAVWSSPLGSNISPKLKGQHLVLTWWRKKPFSCQITLYVTWNYKGRLYLIIISSLDLCIWNFALKRKVLCNVTSSLKLDLIFPKLCVPMRDIYTRPHQCNVCIAQLNKSPNQKHFSITY